jgi:hypothetical protein
MHGQPNVKGKVFLPQELVNTDNTKTNFRSLLQNTVYHSPSGQIAPRWPKTVLSKKHWLSACDTKITFSSLITVRYPTPRSSVITEKPTVLQSVKKFPALYGTRRFVTAFTTVRQLSLSWAISDRSTSYHPIQLGSLLMLLGAFSKSFVMSSCLSVCLFA